MESKLNGKYTTKWEKVYAKRMGRVTPSAIREILKVAQDPTVISFAGGLPAPELFPIREFREACEYVLVNEGKQALQYGPTEGYRPLKEWIAETVRKYGVPAEPENVLLTNGSQQALDLVGEIFIDEGDKIITDEPTYLGAIQAWNPYGPQYLTVPLDKQGMQVDKVEELLEEHPDVKFIYVLPNFHNPGGTTLPLERRMKLAEIAAKHGVFIIEDDPYGELRFEGEDIPPIISMHKENVIYLSTFSKTLAPGIRLGWIIAPEQVIKKLVLAKQGKDLHTSTFIQHIAYDICHRGILKAHVKKIRKVYSHRRDVMLKAMEEHFPKEGFSWTHPEGGLFLFVWMPESINAEELFHRAVEEEKVAFVPGSAFYPNGGGQNTMRLNFSCMPPERIEEGIKRLGKLLKDELAKKG